MAIFPLRSPYLHISKRCMSGSTAVMWVWTRRRNAHLHACVHLTAQGTHTHHADTSNCGSWLWLNANAAVSMWLKPKQWYSVWHNVNLWEAHEYGGVCKAKPRYQHKDFQSNTAQKHTWQYERRVRFISLHAARRAQREHQELSMCLALEK